MRTETSILKYDTMKSKIVWNVLIITISLELTLFSPINTAQITSKQDSCTPPPLSVGNGTLTVLFNKECESITYQLQAAEKSSIISIALDVNVSTPNPPEDALQLIFTEPIIQDGRNEVTSKQINLLNRTEAEAVYFSRTPSLQITIKYKGSLEQGALKINYTEIQYISLNRSSSAVSGIITPWVGAKGRVYRPNSVYHFQVRRAEGVQVSSIDVVLNELDIEGDNEEYLLIGAGTPFEGPPALFITSNHVKKYKINDEQAYFVFVSASTRTLRSGFNISWFQNGDEVLIDKQKKEDFRKDDVLQSVPICISNITAAMEEMNTSDPFIDARKKIAELANDFAKSKGLSRVISEKDVTIFRVSGVIEGGHYDDLREGALYASVKIQGEEEGTAAFRSHHLRELIDTYSSNHSETINGYQLRSCPRSPPAPQKMWSNVGFYIVVPLLCCAFLLVWTWNQNPLSKKFFRGGRMHRPALVENPYIISPRMMETIPVVRITNDYGRRYTLNFEPTATSCADEEDSDVEIFNKQDFIRTTRPAEYQQPQDTRSLKGAENRAFEDDECILTKPQLSPSQTDEKVSTTNDNVYDSLKSVKAQRLHEENDKTKL